MHIRKLTWLAVFLLLPISVLAQSDYMHGHGAIQIFDEQGMKNTPQWVMAWIMFMAATFICGLFFVKNHIIARWVVGGFVAGLVLGEVIRLALGIPPYSGYIALIHIVFWSPALYQLVSKRPFLNAKGAYKVWSGIITAVILFSFVFDIRDAVLFLRHVL